MLTLAFDTSAPLGSVALIRDGQLLAESATDSSSHSPRAGTATHSTNLMPAIESLLSKNGLRIAETDLLGVGLGPGSFTGIRVAIATAKGLGLALRKPVVGVSSMDALALSARDRLPAGCSSLAVLVDAGRGEVYCSAYSVLENQFFKVNDAAIFSLDGLRPRILAPTFFVGPGIGSYREALQARLGGLALVDDRSSHPPARLVGLLAEEKFAGQKAGDADLEPTYLRTAVTKR